MEEHDDGGEEHRQRQQRRSVAVAAANSASGELAELDTDMIITTTPSTTTTMTNLSKFKLFVRAFFLESSSCGLTVLSISILVSLSLSSTAGVVPEVVTDRYARLRYGYGQDTNNDYSDNNKNNHYDLDHHDACWMYTTDDMPPACTKGADDAQTASAYGSLVMNGVLFVVNSSIGRATDMYGRRIFLVISIFLYTLSPAALLYIQRFPKADPVWYFGARAMVGIMDFNTITFAALSDVIPTVHRAASFAVILGGFYVSYAFGPALAVVLSHQQATFASWILSMVALVVAILFFPETLHQTSQSYQSAVEGHVDNHLIDYVALTETVVEETYPPAPPSSAFLGASCQQQQQQQQEGEGGETPYMDQEQQETSSCDNENENESEAGVAVLSNRTNEEDCGGRERKNMLSRFKDLVLKPVRDMSILRRNQTLTLVALGSFLASTVYNVDHTLVLFYVEEHLDVRVHDIAQMLFVLGIVGVIMQCFAFQPLVQCFGEHGLLIITYISGTVHNFIYGAARKKSAIYSALALSQLTKLNFPILSSLASQEVDESSQGQVQGAMLGLNALAGAFGPLAMNVVYEHTKDGTMFLVSSGLYFTGLLAVIALSRDNKHRCRDEELSSHRQPDDAQHSPRTSSGGIDHESSIEEPLLPQAI